MVWLFFAAPIMEEISFDNLGVNGNIKLTEIRKQDVKLHA
jgi:hypothetical protein